jgi:hypothetical protein
MSFAAKVPASLLRRLAERYAADGIHYERDADAHPDADDEEEDGELCCAPCGVALEASQLREHVASAAHAAGVDEQEGVADGVEVSVNGRTMVLDHHAVFPETIFGAGRLLYSNTLKCLLPADVCGAVELAAGHEYTVVEFAAHDHELGSAPVAGVRKRMRSFAGLRGESRGTVRDGVPRSEWEAPTARDVAAAFNEQWRKDVRAGRRVVGRVPATIGGTSRPASQDELRRRKANVLRKLGATTD